MSPGPGHWQRTILAALEQHQAFFARDLLGIAPTRAQQVALQRAVCTLHDVGKIAIARWWGRNPAGGRVVIFRHGTLEPPPHEIARIQHLESRERFAIRKRRSHISRNEMHCLEFDHHVNDCRE